MNKKNIQNKLWFIHGILVVILCLGWIQFNMAIKSNNACAEGLNYIEYLNSSVQRLAKLEMRGSPNEELAYHLNNVMYKLDSTDIYGENSFVELTETDSLVLDLQSDWKAIFEEIEQTRTGDDGAELLFASERFYNTAIQLYTEVSGQFMQISSRLFQIQIFLILVIVLMIALIAVSIYNTIKELAEAKKLSEKMFIDASTGLFNRSKCHDMLKSETTPDNSKSRIIIMLDLNDLKITNDKYGHQIGDELIANFARLLKESCKVHNFEIFVGRYGGDEFMVYYPSAEKEDALLYLKEMDYLTEQFNSSENKYQISFASGYAVFGKDRSDATMRDLFDEADANMYENKAKFKNARIKDSKCKMCGAEVAKTSVSKSNKREDK